MKRKIISVIAAVVILAGLFHGGESPVLAGSVQTQVKTDSVGISIDEESGNAELEITYDEFVKLGFEPGDSVDIRLSNGYEAEDIPVYNGFYTKYGKPLVLMLPDNKIIIAASASSFAESSEADSKDTAKITLKEKGAYADIQKTMDLTCSSDRKDYDSEEEFANFYEIKGGNLKEGLFYRSASPVNNEINRASLAEDLLVKSGIRHVINVSDSPAEADKAQFKYNYFPRYYNNLKAAGSIDFLNLNADYKSKKFAEAVADSLLDICDKRGPYLIHGLEGKDRTGYISALILALAGADAEEIRDDYMKSYENFYGITEKSDPETYKKIVEIKANDIMYYLACASEDSGIELESADFRIGAVNYLRYGGLTNSQILYIKCLITEE